MLSRQNIYNSNKVLSTTYNPGSLISPGLIGKKTPLIVPDPIHEKFNRDKILNDLSEGGQFVDTKEKLIVNNPKQSIPLPEVNKEVEIGTKSKKRKASAKETEEFIDFSASKNPKSNNLSKYRLQVKD